MPSNIEFTDISTPKHNLPIILGVILCVISGTLIVTSNKADITTTNPIPVITGIIGIALIAIPQIINVRKANTIRYNKRGLTAKLVGHKTFGFEFSNIEATHLKEKQLEIVTKNGERISLSRKQYNQKSLQKIIDLITQQQS